MSYISLLRGINVGGKVLRMENLKLIYGSLGLTGVRSYIQSGNLFFDAPGIGIEDIKSAIEGAIKSETGLDVAVLILKPDELKAIIEDNPLIKAGITDIDKMHVTILSGEPSETGAAKIDPAKYEPDRFVITGKAVYIYCPNGYGRTKLTNNFWEAKLKVHATTRNWNTINKLYEIAAGGGS